jgi:hypothetical protein
LQTQEEEKTINAIEDEIFNLLDDSKNCIVSVIIFTNNFKEYVIYHNNNIDFEKYWKEIQGKFMNYKFTTYTSKDKNWEVYYRF